MGLNKKALLNYVVVILSVTASYFAIKTVLNSPLKVHKQVFKVTTIDGLENKLSVIFTTLYYTGVLLFITQFLVMVYRFKSGKNPVNSNQDPKIVVCLNRIIGNTIEQAFVFFPFYIYWLHIFNINRTRIDEALSYPLLFLIGRFLFAVGYLLGTIFNLLPLRTTGMSINYVISSFILLQTQGISLTKRVFA